MTTLPLSAPGPLEIAALEALRCVVAKHDEWTKQMPLGCSFDDPLQDAIENASAAIRKADGALPLSAGRE